MAIAARRQPQGLSRVNRSNPINAGTVAVWNPAAGLQNQIAENASNAVLGSLVRSVGAQGIEYRNDGTASNGTISPIPVALQTFDDFSVEMLVNIYATAATYRTLFCIGDGSGDPNRLLAINITNTNTFRAQFAAGGTSASIIGGSASVGTHRLIARRIGTSLQLFDNGVSLGTTTLSGTLSRPGGLTFNLLQLVFAEMPNAGIAHMQFWRRGLSNAEIASRAANPWQTYDAPSQTQFPMPAVASTGTTVTATPATLAAFGLPASVSSATSIAGAVATLAASGQAATITLPTAVAASVATSTAAGRTASVTLPIVIGATSGTSAASGLAAIVSTGAAISATTGTVTAAGQTATIATQLNIAATPGASTAAGLGATIVSGAAIVASVGTVTATGLAATLVTATTINATCGTGAASGLLASIQSGAAISATAGQITATGRTASIVSGVSISCGVGVASAAGRAAFIPVATLVSCISGAATAVGLTASIALDRPAPLPNRHNLYSGLPRNRAYLGAARNRNYKGQP